jgi:hypothetical protein
MDRPFGRLSIPLGVKKSAGSISSAWMGTSVRERGGKLRASTEHRVVLAKTRQSCSPQSGHVIGGLQLEPHLILEEMHIGDDGGGHLRRTERPTRVTMSGHTPTSTKLVPTKERWRAPGPGASPSVVRGDYLSRLYQLAHDLVAIGASGPTHYLAHQLHRPCCL